MRKHLFRGKAKKDGEWYYGDLLQCRAENKAFIDTAEFADESGTIYKYNFRTEVDPETVGEYIGIPDKNNKMIYEGDIIEWNPEVAPDETKPPIIGTVIWYQDLCQFCLQMYNRRCVFIEEYQNEYKTIGNIYDNPELLGGR